MNLEQYYLELSIFVASVISGLALKDWSVSFIKGLNFKMNPQFKEGDKVKLDGEDAFIRLRHFTQLSQTRKTSNFFKL